MGKLRKSSLANPHIINFAKCSERRYAQEMSGQAQSSTGQAARSSAYMMTDENIPDEEDKQIFAVLDTGCNNTCHGDRWMMKYAKVHGFMPEAEDADGKFRGVGGKVMVSCKCTIPVHEVIG